MNHYEVFFIKKSIATWTIEAKDKEELMEKIKNIGDTGTYIKEEVTSNLYLDHDLLEEEYQYEL